MTGLHLVHDVLDAQLVDRRKRKIGRVDSVVLAIEDGRPPRVAAILVGGPARADRIGRWMAGLSRAVRALVSARGGVSRIPFSAVRVIAETIEVDVDGDALESGRLEAWLVQHVVRRIPGSGAGEGDSK